MKLAFEIDDSGRWIGWCQRDIVSSDVTLVEPAIDGRFGELDCPLDNRLSLSGLNPSKSQKQERIQTVAKREQTGADRSREEAGESKRE